MILCKAKVFIYAHYTKVRKKSHTKKYAYMLNNTYINYMYDFIFFNFENPYIKLDMS